MNSTNTAMTRIRQDALKNVNQGAITTSYNGDRSKVISLLNECLATELICMLRYKSHYYLATGIHAKNISEEFLEHAGQEQQHADAIARRIMQLGGRPDFSPDTLQERSHADYTTSETLQAMIVDNLVAERIAIDNYRVIIRLIGDNDPTTRRILEDILAMEEEHADELAGLLEQDNQH